MEEIDIHDEPGVKPTLEISTDVASIRPKLVGSQSKSKSTQFAKENKAWVEKKINKIKRRDTLVKIFGYIVLLGYLAIGAFIFWHVNPTQTLPNGTLVELTYVDTLYFATVTLTTVGYGDITPETDEAKIFVCLFILFALALLAVTSDFAKFLFSLEIDADDSIEDYDNEDQDLDQPITEEELRVCFMSKGKRILVGSISTLILVVASGVVFFVSVENYRLLDAIYFSIVTLTTVGYGDFSPETTNSKIFNMIWIAFGCFGLFNAIKAVIKVLLEKKKLKWRNRIYERRKQIRETIRESVTDGDFSQFLSDENEEFTENEFILFGLEQSGKVSSEDIVLLQEKFRAMECGRIAILEDVINVSPKSEESNSNVQIEI